MMIDFTTGMTLNGLERSPQPYLLRKNHNGHYVFDIQRFLTAGNSNTQGHVRVRVTPPRQSAPNESQVPQQYDASTTVQPAIRPTATWFTSCKMLGYPNGK